MRYKCQHFEIYELVDKETYNKYGEFAWSFLDDRLLRMIDFLREEFGKATINDWYWGGTNENRGLRSPTSTVGAKYSQHKFGRAADILFDGVTAEEVRQFLKDVWTFNESHHEFGSVVKITLEDGVGWLHIDVRNNDNMVNSFSP